MGPRPDFCHKPWPPLICVTSILPHCCLASIWGGRWEAHKCIPHYPSLLPSIPPSAPFFIFCPDSFSVSLYLLLFPELCFPLTICSSTSWAVLACGPVGLHHPTSYASEAVWLTCLPVSPMLSCLQIPMRGREGESVGLLQGSDPFWLFPFPEVRPTDSLFFL